VLSPASEDSKKLLETEQGKDALFLVMKWSWKKTSLIIALISGLVIAGLVTWAVIDFSALIVGDEAYDQGDYETALEEWLPLAEDGFDMAQRRVAWLYYDGKGVPENTDEALWWLERAGESGYWRALKDLGVLYRIGVGLDQDPVETYKWYTLALEMNPDDDGLAGLRMAVSKALSDEEIVEANRRADEWRAAHWE